LVIILYLVTSMELVKHYLKKIIKNEKYERSNNNER